MSGRWGPTVEEGGVMGLLDDAKEKLTNLVNDNPDKVEEFSDKGLDAAADKANDLTGGKYADQIQQGRDTADEKIGE
jgi:hypothetical protein